MTREHKLALIVGFSLMLVVGVLVSDYFSKASTIGSPAVLAKAGQASDFGGKDPFPSDRGMQAMLPPTVPPAPSNVGKLQVADGPSAQTPPPQQPPIRNINQNPAVREIAMSDKPVPSGPGLGSGAELVKVINEPDPTLIANSTGLPVSREPLRRHEVRDGDSMYRIAQQAYGEGRLWEKVRDYPANRGRVGENGSMREGATILLPPKDVLLGRAVLAEDRVGGPSSGLATQPPVAPEANLEPRGATYWVRSGDTLADIARRKLGSVARVQEIIDLNSSTLPDPDSLKVGMTLKLPSR